MALGTLFVISPSVYFFIFFAYYTNKGNNKITELRTILQRVKTHKYINRQNQSTTGKL